MSSGGGTTTQVTKNELPAWLQDAAQSNLARADYVSQLGYVPQYGLDVAGFTPMQQSAMQNTANAASAFGLSAPTNAMAGMPAQQTNNLGFSGYSSGALYDDALAQLAQNRPAQYEAINSMFIDPTSGQTDAIFTPEGSIASNNAATINVNDIANAGGNWEPTEDQSALAKYMAAQDYNRSPSNTPWYAPAGITANLLDPVARWANNQYMDYFEEQFPQGANEFTDTGFIAAGPDMYGSGSGYGGTSYDMTSASNASRQSSALDSGTGLGIGSGGGNASRGFSTGGW